MTSACEHLSSSTNTNDGYIDSWPDLWSAVAVTMGRKSKDPNARVGAIIVRENRILATGFNGLVRGVPDDPAILDNKDEKLKNVVHAELNAVLNAAHDGVAIAGATVYVNKFPCYECLKALVQAGIVGVYTDDEWYWNSDPVDADHSRKRRLIKTSGIKIEAPFHADFAPKRSVATEATVTPIVEVPLVRKPARRAPSRAQSEMFRDTKADGNKKR